VRDRFNRSGCHQIVTKTAAKRAKTRQIPKIENGAILRLAKGIYLNFLLDSAVPIFQDRRFQPLTRSSVSKFIVGAADCVGRAGKKVRPP